jgi:hypothetical protein
VTPYNIEFYKFHNYGHIARECRRMTYTYMKENIDIRYKKIWKREQEHVKEEHMKEEHPKVILLGCNSTRLEKKNL